jgi:L-ribulose-5-phosphate 3-epimerase
MKAYEIGLYEKAMPGTLTWPEKLAFAGQAGFDYVEISIDETDAKLSRLDMDAAQRTQLIDEMRTAGVPIRSMCLSGHRKYPLGSLNTETRARGMEIMEKAIQLAADLGIRTIQLAGYDVYYEPGSEQTRALFAQNLQKSVDMAAAAGVILAFETMETAFMNTVTKAMDHVERVNSPYLQVYPDIGNITNAAKSDGSDVLEDLERGRGHLAAMHLKETVPGVFREVPFGTGHVDFDAAIAKAWALGVRRYVTEMWYTGSDTWQEDVRDANRRMTEILDRQV